MLIKMAVGLNFDKLVNVGYRASTIGFAQLLIVLSVVTPAVSQEVIQDEATKLLGPEVLRSEVREIIDDSSKFQSETELKDAETPTDDASGRSNIVSSGESDFANSRAILKVLDSDESGSFTNSLSNSTSGNFESTSTITTRYSANLSETVESVSSQISSIVDSANRDARLSAARDTVASALAKAGLDTSHPEITALLSNIDPNIDKTAANIDENGSATVKDHNAIASAIASAGYDSAVTVDVAAQAQAAFDAAIGADGVSEPVVNSGDAEDAGSDTSASVNAGAAGSDTSASVNAGAAGSDT
ncbi:MAG: hypothetical protein R3261_08965, partial [Alphaproteobacteria bacterium]|nr:hypothetical protein [Alphaproteobacteria bacterium]